MIVVVAMTIIKVIDYIKGVNIKTVDKFVQSINYGKYY